MPKETELPTTIRALAARQALPMPTRTFAESLLKLTTEIKRLMLEAEDAKKLASKAQRTAGLTWGASFRDADDMPHMVIMPQGRFRMGSLSKEKGHHPSERPRRIVRITERFAVSKFPVTVKEWNSAIRSGLAGKEIQLQEKASTRQMKEALDAGLLHIGQSFSEMLSKLYPAGGITWTDAKAYCAWATTDPADAIGCSPKRSGSSAAGQRPQRRSLPEQRSPYNRLSTIASISTSISDVAPTRKHGSRANPAQSRPATLMLSASRGCTATFGSG